MTSASEPIPDDLAASMAPPTSKGNVVVQRLHFTRDGSEHFYRAVKRRVSEYMTSHGLTRYGGLRLATKAVIFGATSLGFYILTVAGGLPDAQALLTAILFGLSALFFAINIGHEAAHDTLSQNRTVNRVVQFLAFAPIGADAPLWRLRHVKSHHVSPNVEGFDVDAAENGFVRLSPLQKLHWYNRYQHLYAPLIYWMVDLHSIFFHDLRYFLSGRMENIRFERRATDVVTFAAQKVVFILILFVIPYLAMERPWSHILLGALVVTFFNSVVFVYMLIGTHHCEETAYPVADPSEQVPHGWAYHQLATSMDWSPLSPTANFLAGGTNAHAAHHLFPNISHVHYMPITRIIQDEAARHDMPYNQSKLFPMLASHFRHLRMLGRMPNPTRDRQLAV